MIVDRFLARLICIPVIFALAIPANAALACEDYVLSEGELSAILDSSLGELQPFVTDSSVKVEPQDASCYLKMRVSVEA